MLINRTYRTYVNNYPRLYNQNEGGEDPYSTTTTTTSLPKLYSGGTYVLTGTEFTVAGSTVTYDLVNNTATLDDPANATSVSCQSKSLDGDLNVSGCISLTELDCYNNVLVSLDVLGCTALTFINCDINSLTSLDISECTALELLTCETNFLTSLNVSGLSTLTTLDCYYNDDLATLNISGCTALYTLYCGGCINLSSVDVSECTSLNEIGCDANSFTSLDISNCTVLKYLYSNDNLFTAASVDAILAALVANGIKGGICQLDGTGNEPPTVAGEASEVALKALVPPWTVTTN